MRIDNIILRKIYDSRQDETLEAEMKNGDFAVVSSIPHGKSRGEKEAVILPINEVLVKFEKIKSEILAKDFISQKHFDYFLKELDNTKNKQNLGGNLMLVLSQSFAKLMAKFKRQPLWRYLRNEFLIVNPGLEEKISVYKPPLFFFNLINGGKHAPYGPNIQEYLVVPQINDAIQSIEIAQQFFQELKIYFLEKYNKIKYGDEGGLLIPTDDYEEPLGIYQQISRKLNLQYKLRFSLDAAASSFYNQKDKKYYLLRGKGLDASALLDAYLHLINNYQIFSLEDPFEENDFNSFFRINNTIGKKTLIIGDDVTVSQVDMLAQAIEDNIIGGIILKPTQVGTISEIFETAALAWREGIKIIMSHRSAETQDNFIADLCFALNCFGLKAGALNFPERMVKYERIKQIMSEEIPNLIKY